MVASKLASRMGDMPSTERPASKRGGQIERGEAKHTNGQIKDISMASNSVQRVNKCRKARKMSSLRRSLLCGLNTPDSSISIEIEDEESTVKGNSHFNLRVNDSLTFKTLSAVDVRSSLEHRSNNQFGETKELGDSLVNCGLKLSETSEEQQTTSVATKQSRTTAGQVRQATNHDRAQSSIAELLDEVGRCQPFGLEWEPIELESHWTSFVQLANQAVSSPLLKSMDDCQVSANEADEEEQEEDEDEDKRQERASSLKVQQDAIWELLSTEVAYIKLLRVLIELFLGTLSKLQREHRLLEVSLI